MARRTKDVFGFDELEKTFEKMQPRFQEKGEAFLSAAARQMKKRIKQMTPLDKSKKKKTDTKHLRNTWQEKKPKEYKNGETLVSLVYTKAPHAHLFDLGHKMVARTCERNDNGRYAKEAERIGKTTKLNVAQRYGMGVKETGYVEGRRVREKALNELNDRVLKDAQKVLDAMTKEMQL